MAFTPPKDIAIIGGSLSGLFAGVILKDLGHRVTILERTPSSALHDQGAGISISPIVPPIYNALIKHTSGPSRAPVAEFFSKYDAKKRQVCEFVKEDDGPLTGGMQFLNLKGESKAVMKVPVVLGSTSWEVLYTVLRGIFDKDESENKKERGNAGEEMAKYLDGAKVSTIQEVGDKMKVNYEDKEGVSKSFEVDLVIGADGPSSLVRKLFADQKGSERKYAGYVAWRGVVPEASVEEETRNLLHNKCTFFYRKENQAVTYNIPGPKSNFTPGQFLTNIVWYQNCPEESLPTILTDASGTSHNFSLGRGKIAPSVKLAQQESANSHLPPNIAKLWSQVESPFIQAITDNLSEKMVFAGGKVLLVGDSVAGLRPHTTAGTSQAYLHALLLGKVFGEEGWSLEKWEKECLEWSTFAQGMGVKMGNGSQFAVHPMAESEPEV